MKQHISYSELKTWAECSWRHKLQYIDGLNPFQGNEFTTFGTALHAVSEKFLVDKTAENPEQYFETQFLNELKTLKEKDKDLVLNTSLVQEMRSQGTILAPQLIPSLKEHFGDYKVVSVEEKLYEPIKDRDFNFKGFCNKRKCQYRHACLKCCFNHPALRCRCFMDNEGNTGPSRFKRNNITPFVNNSDNRQNPKGGFNKR